MIKDFLSSNIFVFILGISIFLLLYSSAGYVFERYSYHAELSAMPELSLPDGLGDERIELQWLYWLTILDPVYAFPGMDTAKFNESLLQFQSEKRLLANMYVGDLEMVELILNEIYPEDFLEQIVYVEELRRQFIAAPSEDLAIEYYSQVRSATELLIKYNQWFINSVEPEEYSGAYAQWGGVITKETFLSALHDIDRQAHKQKSKAETRLECLNTLSAACERPTAALRDVKNYLTEASVDAAKYTNLETGSSTADIVGVLEMHYGSSSYAVTENPDYYILSNDWCAPSSTPSTYVLIESVLPGFSFLRTEVVSDLYFHETGSSRSPFLQELNRNGVLYEKQIMNMYSCADYPKVLSSLLTLDYLKQEVTGGALSLEIEGSKQKEIAALNNALHESVMAQYLENLFLALVESPKQFDETAQKSILESVLLLKTRSFATEQLMGAVGNANNDLLEASSVHDFLYVPDTFEYLINRSYLPALLFVGNRTVFPDEITFYDKKRQPWYYTDNNLRAYYGDLEHEFSLDELLTQLNESVAVYRTGVEF